MLGGQQQWVVVVWVLVFKFIFILVDEFIVNLDFVFINNLFDIMVWFNKEEGVIFIFSMYDQWVIDCVCWVVILDDGKIIKDEVWE